MAEMAVGVRELKSHLSKYLRQVKAGRTILITERGLTVGRIVPERPTVEARLQAMIDAGLLTWSGRKFTPMKPVARTRGARTVADLISEDRR